MRILIVVPRMNIGGAESYSTMLARKLTKRGHTVIVASGGGSLARILEKEGIKQYFLPLRLSTGISAYLMARIIRREKIDIIHANSSAAGIASVKMNRYYVKDSIPIIYTVHGVFGGNTKEKDIKYADKIICVSEMVRRHAAEQGVAEGKLLTLYNGVDTDVFRPREDEKSALRQRLKIPEDAFTLVISSRIKNLKDKGHMDMLKVLSSHEGRFWHLLVVGSGKGVARLVMEVKKRGLSGRVHMAGHMTNVEDILFAADALVLPSMFETFGLVLAEGMAMALPVVAYDVGGTGEVISDGETGFLVKREDIQELTDKLKILAEDKDLRKRMGEAGRERVLKYFSAENLTDNLEKAYIDVLKQAQ